MTPNSSNLTRGYAIALLSAGVLSTTAIFIRYLTLTYQIPPLVLAFWRDSFVFFCLLFLLRLLRPALLKLERQFVPYIMAYGLVLAMFNALWTLSVALNGAAVSTVLAYCSAGFTVLLGWLWLKERLDWAKLVAVALSLAGCVLVSDLLRPGAWRANMLGIIAGIVSGLCYAGYSLMGRSASQRGLNPWTTVLYTFGLAAGFLLLFNLVLGRLLTGSAKASTELLWLGKAWAGWGILLLLAAGPTLIGFGLYNTSLTYLPAGVANLIVTIEPVFTAVTAYFLLGERPNAWQVVGGVIIMTGVVFLRIFEGRVEIQTRIAVQNNAQLGE